jgi:hypothetical protein
MSEVDPIRCHPAALHEHATRAEADACRSKLDADERECGAVAVGNVLSAEAKLEHARFWFDHARKVAIHASRDAAALHGIDGLAARLSECNAWELAGRAAIQAHVAYEALGNAIEEEPLKDEPDGEGGGT